jgi:hypothetical protein
VRVGLLLVHDGAVAAVALRAIRGPAAIEGPAARFRRGQGLRPDTPPVFVDLAAAKRIDLGLNLGLACRRHAQTPKGRWRSQGCRWRRLSGCR